MLRLGVEVEVEVLRPQGWESRLVCAVFERLSPRLRPQDWKTWLACAVLECMKSQRGV